MPTEIRVLEDSTLASVRPRSQSFLSYLSWVRVNRVDKLRVALPFKWKKSNPTAVKEGNVNAYRFLSPIGLFSVLHGIEAQIAAQEWDMAAKEARNLGDEARHQKSGDTENASLWREFILHVDCLNISIRAKDATGCVGELATLHSALTTIAGPESKE